MVKALGTSRGPNFRYRLSASRVPTGPESVLASRDYVYAVVTHHEPAGIDLLLLEETPVWDAIWQPH